MIRQRLLNHFVLVALLPTVLIATSSFIISYRDGRSQVLERLELVNDSKKNEITAWIHAIELELTIQLNEQLVQGRPTVILDLAENEVYYDFYLKAAQKQFQRFVTQSSQVVEIQLLDGEGSVIVSTDDSQTGSAFPDQAFFQRSLGSDLAVSFPFDGYNTSSSNASQNELYLAAFSIPVKDTEGKILGLLVGIADANQLTAILEDVTALGETGKTILANQESCFTSKMDGVIFEKPCHTADAYPMPQAGNSSTTDIYQDSNDRTVIGVSSSLPELNSLLVIEQEQAETFRAIWDSLRVNIFLIIAALIFALLVSTVTSRSISRPLGKLVDSARLISRGQLDKPVEVTTDDEIGILSNTFNDMTDQLRSLINTLELKVEERTLALQNHAAQLKTLAKISRDLTSILDSDQLTERIAAALSESFEYENINFYTLDEKNNCFILHKKNGHSSEIDTPQTIDQAVVEKVLSGPETGSFRELKQGLFDTKSENQYSQFIIPLLVGGKMIAFINIQSDKTHVFSAEEKLILQSLGDQIAIALQNAKLYDDARQLAKMEERQRIARDMHDSVSQSIYSVSLLAEGGMRLIEAGDYQSAHEYFQDLIHTGQDALKEMRLMMFELRPPVLAKVGLIGALQQRLDAVEGRAGITTRLFVPESLDIPVNIEEELYLVAMEALNNALRHSNGTEIQIKISTEDHSLNMEVNDNGQGIKDIHHSMKKGMGIRNMYERIHKIGGIIAINTSVDLGTQVQIQLKYPYEE